MHIAFFTETYEPSLNGVTTILNNFRKILRAQGHTVYIFAPRVRGHKDKDPDVFRLPSLKVVNSEPEGMLPVPIPASAFQKMASLKFDLVHAHGNAAFSLVGYQVARSKHIPFILTFHNDHAKYTHYIFKGKLIKPSLISTGLRIFAGLCDGVLTPSKKMEKELVKYGVKKKITVIPNFVEFDKFQISEKDYLYKTYNIPKSEKIVLSVGRLTKEKNLEFTLNVFAQVVKTNPNTSLVVVGKGPEEENLKAQAEKLGIEKKVYFTGVIEASVMPKVYNSAYLLIFPSITEVHPLVVLEAGAAGLPLVTSNDIAFDGVVKTEFNGFALPLKEEKFVAVVNELIKGESKAKTLGENARKFIHEHYSPEAITKKLVDYYQEIIEEYSKKEPRKLLLPLMEKAKLGWFIKATGFVNKFISY